MKRKGLHRRATTITVASLVMLATVLVGPATPDTEIKVFSASVTPGEMAVGSQGVTFTVTLTNELGTPHSLGSARVHVPDVFGGGIIELNYLDLQPGASTSATVTRDVPCAPAATYTWAIEAKQSNDFNGTGNDFVGNQPTTAITGSCYLAFDAQPADGERDKAVASVPYGDAETFPIKIGIYDGTGTRTGSWTDEVVLELVDNPGGSSTTSWTAGPGAGVAAFTATSLDASAAGYTMQATSSNEWVTLVSDDSDPFTIVDEYVACDGGPCRASSRATNPAGDTEATVESESAGAIILSVGSATSALDCAGYDAVSGVIEFDVLDSEFGKTVHLTWTPWEKPARKYRVCWGVPAESGVEPFTTRDGAPADLVGGWYVGLLPNCRGKAPVAPCVSSYSQSRKDGTVELTVLAPPGDPRMRI